MAMRIYTKTGDKGSTSLIGGTKVPKSHLRIESYGTVDELNSFVGLLGDQLILAGTNPSLPADANPSLPADTNPSLPADANPSLPADTNPSLPADTNPSIPSSANPSVPPNTAPSTPPGASTSVFADILPLLREIQDRLFTIGSSLACDPEKEPKLKIPDLKEQDITTLEKDIDRMDAVLPPMRSFLLPGGHVAVSTAHIVRTICRRAERTCVRLQEEHLYVEPIVIRYLNRLSDYFFQLSRYIAHVLNTPEIPWKPRV